MKTRFSAWLFAKTSVCKGPFWMEASNNGAIDLSGDSPYTSERLGGDHETRCSH